MAHLSTLAAPKSWPIKRKGIKWITRPKSGPHNLKSSLPLIVVLRDMLKLTKISMLFLESEVSIY